MVLGLSLTLTASRKVLTCSYLQRASQMTQGIWSQEHILNRNIFNVNTAIIHPVFQRTWWYHRHLCSTRSDVWSVNCSNMKIQRPQSCNTNAWNFVAYLFIYMFILWVTVKQIKKKSADFQNRFAWRQLCNLFIKKMRQSLGWFKSHSK